jgi:hypothetical protein
MQQDKSFRSTAGEASRQLLMDRYNRLSFCRYYLDTINEFVEILKKVKTRYPVVWDWVEDINGILLGKSRPRRMSYIREKYCCFLRDTSVWSLRCKKRRYHYYSCILYHLSAEDVAHFGLSRLQIDRLAMYFMRYYQVYLAMSGKELLDFSSLDFLSIVNVFGICCQ